MQKDGSQGTQKDGQDTQKDGSQGTQKDGSTSRWQIIGTRKRASTLGAARGKNVGQAAMS